MTANTGGCEDRSAGRDAVVEARAAQHGWRARGIERRLGVIRGLRHRIAAEPAALIEAIGNHRGREPGDSLVSEIIPLADACRFLERRARRLLAPRKLGTAGRPLWLARAAAEVHREPLGVVLIVAPGNYPLFLAGVQLLQALAAGNAVIVKPAPGCSAPIVAVHRMLVQAGLPAGALRVLPESTASAHGAIEAGVDKVALTGAADTGRTLLKALAPHLTPATLELSGSDSVYVLPGADLGLTAEALAFGLSLNGGATCIAPRRVFVGRDQAEALEARLRPLVDGLRAAPLPAAQMRRVHDQVERAANRGGRVIGARPAPEAAAAAPVVVAGAPRELALRAEDLFAPLLFLVEVDDVEEALQLADDNPYALGASVFGPEREAQRIAARINAGSVTVNDLIVPTADPRLPFGGRRQSGYGVTRGAEGLLEFTAIKSVSVRRGRARPHFAPRRPSDAAVFTAYLRAVHGGRRPQRARALLDLMKALMARVKRRVKRPARTTAGPSGAYRDWR